MLNCIYKLFTGRNKRSFYTRAFKLMKRGETMFCPKEDGHTLGPQLYGKRIPHFSCHGVKGGIIAKRIK